eukprot:SAG31_NODE_1022_length_10309_cov_9.623874_4_plen_204_part_00
MDILRDVRLPECNYIHLVNIRRQPVEAGNVLSSTILIFTKFVYSTLLYIMSLSFHYSYKLALRPALAQPRYYYQYRYFKRARPGASMFSVYNDDENEPPPPSRPPARPRVPNAVQGPPSLKLELGAIGGNCCAAQAPLITIDGIVRLSRDTPCSQLSPNFDLTTIHEYLCANPANNPKLLLIGGVQNPMHRMTQMLIYMLTFM